MNHEVDKLKYIRAIQGAGYAIGAPLGLVLIKMFRGHSPLDEIKNNYDIYLYMIFGSMLSFIVFGYIIGKHEDRLETLSILDPLTELYNRRYFKARIEDEFAIARRHKKPLSLAIIDIDKFKMINDKYGHPVGDKVLISASQAISGVIRKGETVARIGGEEFAIILPDCTDDIAYMIIERVRAAIFNTFIEISHGKKIFVSVSAGIACYSDFESTDDINDLYEKADKALYKAKETGRNRAVIS